MIKYRGLDITNLHFHISETKMECDDVEAIATWNLSRDRGFSITIYKPYLSSLRTYVHELSEISIWLLAGLSCDEAYIAHEMLVQAGLG